MSELCLSYIFDNFRHTFAKKQIIYGNLQHNQIFHKEKCCVHMLSNLKLLQEVSVRIFLKQKA